ncbi:molybdopterin-binding protein [Herbidospora sp. RD11066]
MVLLDGDIRHKASFSVDDLRALPQHDVEISFACRTSGQRRHRFSGPLLLDVATAAQPSFNPAERKDRLRFLISILGADGHHAVLSWGEIDPEFAGIAAVLGTTMDGCPLTDPHLVVPGDMCGGRQISGITQIRIWSDDQLWKS